MTEDELPQGVRDLLADDTTWAEPAPGGADALLAAIRAEPRQPTPDVAPPPEPEPRAVPAPPAGPEVPPTGAPPVVPLEGRRRARRWRVLAAAAAFVVVVGAVGAVVVSLRGDDGAAREVALAGTELAPGATAEAMVEEVGSGVAIELDVSGLEPAPPGTYYQAWLRNDDRAVTIGTFHLRGGDEVVELWAGIDLDEYPMLTVTIEPEDADQASSGQVVLAGEVG